MLPDGLQKHDDIVKVYKCRVTFQQEQFYTQHPFNCGRSVLQSVGQIDKLIQNILNREDRFCARSYQSRLVTSRHWLLALRIFSSHQTGQCMRPCGGVHISRKRFLRLICGIRCKIGSSTVSSRRTQWDLLILFFARRWHILVACGRSPFLRAASPWSLPYTGHYGLDVRCYVLFWYDVLLL